MSHGDKDAWHAIKTAATRLSHRRRSWCCCSPWIGIYGTLTDTDITEVVRGISAVANTSVPGAPFVTESVGLGIAIYMLAAIGLGIALAFGWRTLSPHQPSMDGFVFMIAALSTPAVVAVVVEGFIGIARDTPAYTTAFTH